MSDSIERSLDNCIKCNICVSYCPPAQVTDLFPGPKYAGPQSERFRASQGLSPDRSVDYCNGCRVCNLVCPTGVRIAEINARARARMYHSAGGVPLRNRLLGRSELLGRLAHPVAPLANLLLYNGVFRWIAERTLGIDRRAPLPRFSWRTFRSRVRRRPDTKQSERRRVAYFHGCATNYYEPPVGLSAVAVLERNGVEVVVPDQNCCSLPMLSNGEFDAARRYHEGNLRKLGPFVDAGTPIIGASTSCTLTLKEEARELLDDDSAQARALAAQTQDLSEYLLQLHEAGALDTSFRPLPVRVLYHPPCQLNAHRIGHPAIVLMRMVPDLEVLESGHPCCGIAGTYGLKREKYEIGMAVGQGLFDRIRESRVALTVCDSETCRWQITHATGVPSVHPIQILAWAYGLIPPLAALRGA